MPRLAADRSVGELSFMEYSTKDAMLVHSAPVDKDQEKTEQSLVDLTQRGIRKILMVGPRGIRGFFGWTFFDPANLVCVGFLGAAATLTIISMRDRGAPDWYMPIGLYICLAAFLRGYFFSYYHGHSLSRVTNLLILLFGFLVSAALWEERTAAHEVLRAGGVYTVPAAEGFHMAALLHLACAITLSIHFLLPRHWLIRMTDQVVDRTGFEISLEEESARIQETKGLKAIDPVSDDGVEKELEQGSQESSDTPIEEHAAGGAAAGPDSQGDT